MKYNKKLQLNIELHTYLTTDLNINLKKNEIKNETFKPNTLQYYTNNIFYENLKHLITDIKKENNIEFILLLKLECMLTLL